LQMARFIIVTVLFVTLAYIGHAAPVDTSVQEFLSSDFTSQMSGMVDGLEKFTPEDVAYLMTLLRDSDQFKDENAILLKMERDRPELYRAFIRFLRPYYAKMRRLNAEAQAFFHEVAVKSAALLKDKKEPSLEEIMTIALLTATHYEKLSAAGKQSIEAEFPIFSRSLKIIKDLQQTLKAFDLQ
ncbi:hypothetical protein PFISCL1PPCAC_6904, partial [Pristionchus fissidentatus]